LFYEPSSRTSCSFQAAMLRLGGSVMTVDSSSSSVVKGETLGDTVRTLGSYADAIVVRHPQAGSAQEAACLSPVPILNGGDGVGEHPTQAFLDIFTIREELGTVNGLTITLLGDLKHGRTVHSLVRLLAQYRVQLIYVSPPELRMPSELVQELSPQIAQTEYYDNSLSTLQQVMARTDVLYVTRVQKERFQSLRDYQKVSQAYRIDIELMKHAKAHMIVMHPLPRVDEIDPLVDYDPRAVYFRQMKYGMYVRMALLALVLGSSF